MWTARLILIAVSMTGVSCTLFGRMQPQGRPVMDLAGGPTLVVDQASPLKMAKATPVLSPPEVFAVYVSSHVDRRRDLLIGEHWVFFKLSESEWFSERRAAPEPRSSGAAEGSQAAPLRKLEGFDRAVVPQRESKP